MSSHESPVNDLDRPPKRRIQRRHGACEPCRSSKTKCDGRTPCGACRSERRRQCPCVYSEKAMKLQQVTAEIRRRAESEKQSCDESSKPSSEDESKRMCSDDRPYLAARATSIKDDAKVSSSRLGRDQSASDLDVDFARMSHPLSVCAAVEEFKRLKPARGYSAQVVSRCHGFAISRHSSINVQFADTDRSHLDNATAGSPSRLSGLSAETTQIQRLEMKLAAADAMVKEGHLSRAWVDIGSIIREAQVVQAAAVEDQSCSDSSTWRRLWNNILDLEAQLGLTIGQPTCLVQGRTPRSKTKNDTLSLEDSLEETKTDLYRHIQGMLGLDVNCPTAIRDFLERSQNTLHHEPFNQIGLCTTEDHSAEVRDLHLSTHLLFMVIFCRMASLCDSFSRDLTNRSWSQTPATEIIRSSSLHQPRQKLAYCRRMFRSANFILDSFISLNHRNAEQTGRNWLRCHSAYVAAVILGIAKLRHEVEWHATTEKLKRLEQLFQRLSQLNPHCHLFSTAVERLRDLNSVKEPASEATLNKHTGIKHRKRTLPVSVQTSPKNPEHEKPVSNLATPSASPTVACKRTIDMVDDTVHEIPEACERFMQQARSSADYEQQPQSSQSYDLNLGHLSLFQDISADYSQSNSSFTTTSADSSSATSFSESDMSLHAVADMTVEHPGPPFAYPFPFHVFHPPMAWNSPMYPMHNQGGGQLALQIPVIPQYSTNHSPLACDIGPRYDLGNRTSAKTPTVGTHISSPLQASSDGTATSTRLSPIIHAEPGFKTLSLSSSNVPGNTVGGQSFLQPADTPLTGSGGSVSSRRPSIDRRHSNKAIQQASSSTQDSRHPPPINWHSSSIATVAQGMQTQPLNDGITITNRGHGATPDSTRRSEVSNQRHEAETCFIHPAAPPQSHMIGGQIFPSESVAYLNPATGIFEQPQLQSHYAQSHLPQYGKYYIAESGQYSEQWRRMSVDAGGNAGAPY